eukprot:9416111-Pyramimonas_sp.AAC.1
MANPCAGSSRKGCEMAVRRGAMHFIARQLRCSVWPASTRRPLCQATSTESSLSPAGPGEEASGAFKHWPHG